MGDAFSRCHPILNFYFFAVVLGITMFAQHPLILAISFLGAASYAIWLGGWEKTLKMNMLFTLPGLLIAAVFNPLFNHYGVTRLAYIESSGNWVTLEAIVYGLVLGCVIFIMIQWFACYNKVMTSDKFIYLFGKIIPALSLILSMALRFVPHFQAQMRIIRNGQKCVGMDVSNAGIIKKARYALNMLSILVTWALENAIDTADSMKGRGYGLPGRTAYSIYRFDKRDRWLLALLLALTAFIVYGCAKGAAFVQYNPRILIAGFTILGYDAPIQCSAALSAAVYLAFGVFCFLPLILSVTEKAAMKRAQASVGREMDVTYKKIYEDLEREGGVGVWTL